MGLLQAAFRTYESQSFLAGQAVAGQETLTPISHMVQNAHIEISIEETGSFLDAKAVPKNSAKTIIPAMEGSANRTGDNDKAHPLCDQLRYLAAYGGSKHTAYLSALTLWAESAYSHPKVRAVLHYIQGNTILSDLSQAGVIELTGDGVPSSGKIEGIEYGKCLVRWRVMPAPDGISASCWEDATLFHSFIDYYTDLRKETAKDFCFISGQNDIPAVFHPKGVVAANFGAKLISANDEVGFTYRGRFTEASQCVSIGYTASQKAHSALRWVAANHGVVIGGRTFLWWNPNGKRLPAPDFLGLPPDPSQRNDLPSYQTQLAQTLNGYRMALEPADDVIVAALDAATTGRLSVTYYNEFRALDFLDRVGAWYDSCCWDTRFYGVQSPAIKRIIQCAWGVEREKYMKVDDRVLREQTQRMLHCIIDQQPVPADLVRALAERASTSLPLSPANRENVLYTACAIIRKYHNDQKEEWTLALDESNRNRSYLFGRLLAVAEQVERSTYDTHEGREPNAIRLQALYAQRPRYAWRLLEEALVPYYKRLPPKLRYYYKGITGKIAEALSPDDPDLNKKLDDVYLLGYYHQRTALTRKKETAATEEDKNEPAE